MNKAIKSIITLLFVGIIMPLLCINLFAEAGYDEDLFNVLIISLIINLISNIAKENFDWNHIMWILIIVGSLFLFLVFIKIPFIARIICCADCYDAMATKRVYKEPYTKEKIISEFERCKEIQFDPHIADIVIKLIKEDRLRYGTEEKKNYKKAEIIDAKAEEVKKD